MNGPFRAEPLFPGYFIGGFECSSHRVPSGRRLDMPAMTRHVEFAEADYRRLVASGIRVARDGFSWHRVEPTPGARDFSSVLPLIRAARSCGVRVVWDLLHFGWPDDLDIFQPAFVDRFAALARDFARLLADETDDQPWMCPVNEISFLAWGGADVAAINPFERGRGFELKCQLVRASIAAIEAVRDVRRDTRIVIHDPAYHVVSPDGCTDPAAVEYSRQLQYQGCDLLTGRLWPQLGGNPGYLDVVGVNYYPWNQWTFGTPVQPGAPILQSDPRYRPLSDIVIEWHRRYGRPTYVGETGCEGEGRAAWFRYVCDEMAVARAQGVAVEGVCLYPIVDFPGWDNDRHCENGMWDYADDHGDRAVHEPLAAELRVQQQRLERELAHGAGALQAAVDETPRWPADPGYVDERAAA